MQDIHETIAKMDESIRLDDSIKAGAKDVTEKGGIKLEESKNEYHHIARRDLLPTPSSSRRLSASSPKLSRTIRKISGTDFFTSLT